MMVVVSWSLLTLSIALAAIPRYVWAAVGEQLSKQDISMYRFVPFLFVEILSSGYSNAS